MRAQAHTLEGVVAAMLILTSVVIALQVTAVTPLTASTASQHIEMQERASASGVLAAARANGSVRPTLLYWNNTSARFHGSGSNGYYTTSGPPTAFGKLLNQTFTEDGYAFNVNARYVTRDGNIRERQIVHMGQPSDSATAASVTVTLYDRDVLLDADRESTLKELSSTAFFANDALPDSHVYAVVDVEVVVWRM